MSCNEKRPVPADYAPVGKPTWPSQVLALVLRAYPADFRTRYGGELTECANEARQALGSASRFAVAMFWAATLADIAQQAVREQLTSFVQRVAREDTARGGTARALLGRGLGVLMLAGAASNVGYDFASVHNSMGILAMVLTACSVLTGSWMLWPRQRRAST